MSIDDVGFQFVARAVEWLDTMIYGLGLVVAIWGFLRSRKWGYCVVALYFAWGIIGSLIVPVLAPLVGAHPVRPVPRPYERIEIHPDALIAVLGVWLLARRETPKTRT